MYSHCLIVYLDLGRQSVEPRAVRASSKRDVACARTNLHPGINMRTTTLTSFHEICWSFGDGDHSSTLPSRIATHAGSSGRVALMLRGRPRVRWHDLRAPRWRAGAWRGASMHARGRNREVCTRRPALQWCRAACRRVGWGAHACPSCWPTGNARSRGMRSEARSARCASPGWCGRRRMPQHCRRRAWPCRRRPAGGLA